MQSGTDILKQGIQTSKTKHITCSRQGEVISEIDFLMTGESFSDIFRGFSGYKTILL